MDTLGDRIKFVRGQETQEAFAAKIGVSKGSLGGYERNENSPSSDAVLKICSGADISVEWLMTGRGSIRNDGKPHKTLVEHWVEPPQGMPAADMVLIPMVEAVLSAGHGSLETSAESERRYAFRREFLSRKGNVSAMVLMRVDGDSMEPRICNGDVVLIDQSQQALRPGQIYAVGVEDMVFLKVVSAMPGKVILRSLNEAYPPLEVDTRGGLQDSVRIVGRCVWSCREL